MSRALAAVFAIIFLSVAPCGARAQAWLPDAGEFGFSLVYDDTLNKKHYLPDGGEIDVGHTRTHTIGFVAHWAPVDRWLVVASLPYVQARYYGPAPHPTEVDDGDEHSTFTDLRVELHYQALDGPFAVAPFVAVVKPLRDYETLGHAAPGRNLDEYWVGFYGGASLDRWVPRAYLQVHYDYAFVEKLVGVSHDRSRADLEFGWFAARALSVSAALRWQETHGGIDVPIPRSNPLYPYHDRLAGEDYLNAAVAVGWFPTERSSLSLAYATSLQGRNGHKLDHGLTLAYGLRR